MRFNPLTLLTLAAAASLPACPCGCMRPSVDTLPERALAAESAWSVDVRHDAIDQNERNDGAHAHFVARHRYDTVTIDSRVGGTMWSLSLPRIERIVSTNLLPPATNTTQSYAGLGDASLTTRFDWRGLTVTAGAKLPTGESDRTLNVSRRYLQLGTGSTDLILGLRKDLTDTGSPLASFIQVGAQVPVAHDETFRPGATLDAALGLRLRLNGELTLAAQVSATRQFRDRNTTGQVDAAYAEDLESSVLSTSYTTGLIWTPNDKTHVYVHISEPMSTKNYALKPTGATINPVHASSIVSIGLARQF